MSHQCKNLLVRCMDFRLEEVVEQWIKENDYLGDLDLISVAGSCKDFVAEPESPAAEYLFKQIDLSYQLHQMRRVILTQHQDCGAYGGTEAHGSVEVEKEKLITDMRKLKELLAAKYSDLEVMMKWIAWRGESWEFEEVA